MSPHWLPTKSKAYARFYLFVLFWFVLINRLLSLTEAQMSLRKLTTPTEKKVQELWLFRGQNEHLHRNTFYSMANNNSVECLICIRYFCAFKKHHSSCHSLPLLIENCYVSFRTWLQAYFCHSFLDSLWPILRAILVPKGCCSG